MIQIFNDVIGYINGLLWSETVLFTILFSGLLFTFWTKLGPLTALTHGFKVLIGKYDKKDDPGAINHFQALSAALSATVGLGNIGGVAIAVGLGGPGAVFWMWVVGIFGMSLKMTEVTLAMLYRNTDDPENPHGGPMWVAKIGLADMGLAPIGKVLGALFCVTALIAAVTGGNMFQAWNVAEVSHVYLGIPKALTGVILAVVVGVVIVGGIKRIGNVAGRLVPAMCGIYLIGGIYVILANAGEIPGVIRMIFQSAFSPTEGTGAFLGGSFGYAFLWGMKRALFSNEAGQGSAPMAHAAAKTSEPVREGILAGLGPFIDTLIVCTITALVILSSGAWNRGPSGESINEIEITGSSQSGWTAADLPLENSGEWTEGQKVFVFVKADYNEETVGNKHKLFGNVELGDGEPRVTNWTSLTSNLMPTALGREVYTDYQGATLTAHAFDRVHDGLGMWIVTLASWLFAISTIISWSYYGEQAMSFLFGEKSVLPYKIVYCVLAFIATLPIVRTTTQLGNFTDLGTGVMLAVNLPICLIMGKKCMDAYHSYIRRLKAGEFD